jgi:hypothetical protein
MLVEATVREEVETREVTDRRFTLNELNGSTGGFGRIA